MTSKTPSWQITTLNSLLNTLKRFLRFLESENAFWVCKRDDAVKSRRAIAKEAKYDLEIRHERDWYDFVITRGDAFGVAETLVEDLIEVLEENPFPGEKRTVLSVAVELFPNVKVRITPKVTSEGETVWKWVFEEGKIECRERVHFPEKDLEVSVGELERKLYEAIREDGTLPAAEVPQVLGLKPRGKQYAQARVLLQEKDWKWARRYEDGKQIRIVIAPGRK